MEILKLNKKGVSGAISAMFIIAIFFICLVSTFVIQGLTNSYNQTVLDRNRMDWERTSEHVTFIKAIVANNVLNATFSNDGRVTLHIVQVWLSEFPDNKYSSANWQIQLYTSRYISSGETVNGFGFFPDFKRINVGGLGSLTSLSGLTSQYYKLKLVTERGNTFECQVPWPPEEEDGGPWEGNTYAIIVADVSENFQYQDKRSSYHKWSTAWLKPSSTSGDHCLYRVKLRNTTPLEIWVHSDSFMFTQSYSNDAPRNIVAVDPTGSMVDNPEPTPYVNNSVRIPARSEMYLYFAAVPPDPYNKGGNTQVGDWQKDLGSGWYQVAYLITFHFKDEDMRRIITLPAQGQFIYS